MADTTFAKTIKRVVKRPVRFLAKDWALGVAFPHEYRKATGQAEVDPQKVLFVDVKSSIMPDSFGYIFPYLQDNHDLDVRFVGLAQNERIGWAEYYKRCLALCRELATSGTVFLADACDVTSCLPLRPETKVIQLWHACGAFKKWGMSTTNLLFGNTRQQIERHPFYKNLSLVTVSSPEVAWAYREAMDLESQPEIVKATGVSHTDRFFDDAFLEEARAEVMSAVPEIAGRKVLLYAPTFRGHVGGAEGPDFIDFDMMREMLADEWVLLVKHHPFVKHPPAIPESCDGFAFMVPDVPTDCLMMVADALVTDYSSVVFEFSLLERPIAFLAPDVDDYCDWRGFYYPYHEMTPGPILETTQELARWAESLSGGFDPTTVRAFRDKFMSACDGHATERIVKEALGDLSALAKPPAWERMATCTPDGPDISIIVPAYNARGTLARALDSVLDQTYPRARIELIVVDDCSNDGTWDVLQTYARDHPEFMKAMRTPAQSESPAQPRNVGLAVARGEYVFFMDADDWLAPEAIERMIGHALDWSSDVMLVKLRGEGGRDVPKSMFAVTQPYADRYRSKVMRTFAPLKLFKRNLVSDLRFPDFMPEDISFVLRAYLRADVVSVASDYAYYHVAAEQGDANASVTTWDDVDSNLRAYADIFGLVENHIPQGKSRGVILRRLFERDVCRTLERIGAEQDLERANCQLAKLLDIVGPYYDRKVLSALPTRKRDLLAAAFEDK